MMFRLRKGFLGFLLLCLSPALSAYTVPCPGEFGFYAEWLYMLNAVDQPYFVIDGPVDAGSPQGERVSNEQGWHSGYRVEGIYSFCNCANDVRIRWTSFPDISESKFVEGGNLYGVLNAPVNVIDGVSGSASIRDEFNLRYLDVLFTQYLYDCCPFFLDLQIGIQYAKLNFQEDIIYRDQTDLLALVSYKSRFWGIGPEVGAEFNYCFLPCLSLTGRGYASLLVSKRDARFFDTIGAGSPDNFYNYENEDYWRIVPATNLRFGLSYTRPLDLSCLCCFSWLDCFECLNCIGMDIEVGYEFISYYGGVERIYTVDDVNEGSTFNETMNFTLHGPYVHAGFTF